MLALLFRLNESRLAVGPKLAQRKGRIWNWS